LSITNTCLGTTFVV
jgi:mitogen-activated protein kinase 1/3